MTQEKLFRKEYDLLGSFKGTTLQAEAYLFYYLIISYIMFYYILRLKLILLSDNFKYFR